MDKTEHAARAAMARTVLLVDDHPLCRVGIRSVLGQARWPVEVHEAASVMAAMDQMAAHPRYDLILYDWHLPGDGGLRGLVALCQLAPGVPVIVVSADPDEAIGVAARTVGAAGFLSKAAEPDSIIEVLCQAMGLAGADAEVPNPAPEMQAASADVVLTQRQQAVLRQMAQGQANKRIAKRLGIAETTVRAHVTDILRALGVGNRTEAVVKAMRFGLVDPVPGQRPAH